MKDETSEQIEDLTAALLATSADSNATKVLLHYLLAFLQSRDGSFLACFVAHCEATIAFTKAAKSIDPSSPLRAMLDRLAAAARQ
ncbi:hypothetical protein [Burkholderia gladioli]|uniref:Uncharacterized protein n=1 Tax=Burkholderia gladioli TaxID=28095 RepID=A0AB38TM62_BURGA|nr:hypothetical protein [Burkholderia gladioli]UWX68845.1 hypothetical protein NYZ96_11410 [Burkholderia gladioli]